MIVCSCNAISKNKIEKCIKEGSNTLEEIMECSGASTNCGVCSESIKEILKEKETK